MFVAHTFGRNGPDVELLLIAAALLFLGVTLFVQKTVKPQVSILLMLGSIALATGAFVVGRSSGDAQAAPSGLGVTIVAPEDGATVSAGDEVTIRADVEGGSMTSSTSSSNPREGHLHIYVDGEIISMPTTLESSVTLEPGAHTLTVEFTSADHTSFNPKVTDAVEVTAE
jgi:hypothetical protein